MQPLVFFHEIKTTSHHPRLGHALRHVCLFHLRYWIMNPDVFPTCVSNVFKHPATVRDIANGNVVYIRCQRQYRKRKATRPAATQTRPVQPTEARDLNPQPTTDAPSCPELQSLSGTCLTDPTTRNRTEPTMPTSYDLRKHTQPPKNKLNPRLVPDRGINMTTPLPNPAPPQVPAPSDADP